MYLFGLDFSRDKRNKFLKSLTRKKEFIYVEEGELKRALGLHDLIFLGLGSMLGMGVYIMAGDLAGKVGPAMCISFLVAGFAASLSGLCYAEFAGRIPATGSAYAYCYMTVGEFVAFLLGWNLCLEFVIGTACLVRGMSGYVDSMFQNGVANWEQQHFPISLSYLSPYPDFLAFFIMLGFTGIVSIGVRESAIMNNCFVLVNMTTIVSLIILGLFHVKTANWSLPPGAKGAGRGGFIPFGFSSVMEGAATCFYAYTGFDTVASTGGEAKSPQRTIPLALTLSIGLAVLVYSSVSISFTLMWPYYDPYLKGSPYTYILEQLNLDYLRWAVTIGALAAVTGCSMASTFGLARIVYAISVDGLLYQFLSRVNSCTRTPISATIVSGLFTGCIAIMFTTEQLIDMTSLGTLMAYTMVAVCVLLLRFEDQDMDSIHSMRSKQKYSVSLKQIFNADDVKYEEPNELTCKIAHYGTYAIIVSSIGLAVTIAFGESYIFNLDPSFIILTIIFSFLLILSCVIVGRQPPSKALLSFKVWPVPLVPTVSICINMYLMMKLSLWTWARFAVWLSIGLLIYFSYGFWNSKERFVHKITRKMSK